MAPKERMTARKKMFRDLENEGTSRDSPIYSPDMAPKERMTARKRMFRDFENEGTSRDSQAFHLENTNVETVVNSCNFQGEYL
jgi:hypothetical protein